MLDFVDGKPTMYLGDGVYASYDGFYIILTTSSHDNMESAIYMDVEVFAKLLLFASRIKEPVNDGQGSGDCQDEREVQGRDEEVN